MKHINFREMHQAVIESNVDRKMKIKCHDVVNKMNNEYNKQELNVLWSKIKKYGLIAWFSMIFLIILVGLVFNHAEAKENKICKSEKCEARYIRIVTCQKYTKNKDDVLQCALWKTVFSRKDEVGRHEKEEIKEELKELMERMVGNKKTVHHKNWDLTDKKQETLQKLYDEGVKQGVENIPDMLGTFLGENGNLDMSLRSYKVGSNGYYDYGLCQINKGYHKKIVNDKRFFTDIDFQIENCVRLYKGGTKFYGKVHKEKMKKNLVFNK